MVRILTGQIKNTRMSKQEFTPEEKGQQPRKIEVYGTRGSCEKSFKSSAKTLGELKKDLDANGVHYTDMKIVIGENQEELTENDQVLLDQELTLFLTPIKVRSGY